MKLLPLSQWLSALRPDNTIIAHRADKNITLRDLRADVARLHARLASCSASRLALCFTDTYQFCVALLATLHAAKTPVLPGHNRCTQLAEQTLYFDAVLTDLPLTLPCPVWHLDNRAIASVSLPPIPGDASLTLFTSGSTGEPRRVNKPVAVMDCETEWLAALWCHRLDGCTVRASVSHQHLYGLTFRIWLPLALGVPFECEMVEFPEQLTGDQRCAFITSPAFLQRLDTQLSPPPCDFVLSAGGPLNSADVELTQQLFGIAPDEIYGSTETGVMAWRSRRQMQMLWQPFAGVNFIADAQDSWRVVSPLISEPQGLVLDDRLVFDPQGRFTLSGRSDRVVKIEEKRISLSEIERRLMALDEIEDAAVLIVSRGARQFIGAVVVLNQRGIEARQQLGWLQLTRAWRGQLGDLLEPVSLPRYWREAADIPLNSQSKRFWPQLQELFDATR